MTSAGIARNRRGFTLIELLVVIGIILLLLAILLPVVSQVRTRAYQATTQAQMSKIMAACQSYFHEFNAYPGPVANIYLSGGAKPGQDPLLRTATGARPPGAGTSVTSSENLVLGLLGYLSPPSTTNKYVTLTQNPFPTNGQQLSTTVPLQPPQHDVLSLNTLHPASYHFIDYVADELSPGPAGDARNAAYKVGLEYTAGKTCTDTYIPEFVDRFPEHLPILYMRANAGATELVGAFDTDTATGNAYQYNYAELKDYGSYVHETTTPAWFGPTPTNGGVPFGTPGYFSTGLYPLYAANPTQLADDVAVPYNDWATPAPTATYSYYLANPNIANSVLGKDGFVLISAGVDHVYGTHDDIIVTP